ncbi:uncharacterized protein LOC112463000 [Temnothorax curvispinosus]|uniref:Uncharacterized protein LOC112463000 n=2 Tax=Temnothorax TaxID=300110 RepID=A0A6J1QQX3_9HYME|nr:uncharacterized protein LOC112463000 [Temnothorax curvispinosus]
MGVAFTALLPPRICGIKATRVAARLVSFRSGSIVKRIFNMGFHTVVLATLLLVGVITAYPQKDGQIFSNEAIRQAQNTYLIPKDATIQKVQEGIELAAYESIPGDQRINLFEILGEHVPPEVVNNLQTQIDQIGRN